MKKRYKLKKEFIGSHCYCPKKTLLSDNLPFSTYSLLLKTNPNIFELATTKKNTKFPKLSNDKLQ